MSRTVLALCLMLSVSPTVLAQTKKPRVPPGLDPGGVAVAIATDTGLDYTSQFIAQRVARDGEGELIGWDFVDADRRPFELLVAGEPGPGSMLARTILTEAGASRIAVFRTKPADNIELGRMAVYAARSPARIVLVTTSSTNRADWEAFAEVVTHFKSLLVIAPSEMATTHFPAALGLDNILVVTGHEALAAAASVTAGPAPIDLAVPAAGLGSAQAAARIAALAARLQAADPKLEGAALKAHILSLAKPLSAPYDKATRHGWIAAPHKL